MSRAYEKATGRLQVCGSEHLISVASAREQARVTDSLTAFKTLSPIEIQVFSASEYILVFKLALKNNVIYRCSLKCFIIYTHTNTHYTRVHDIHDVRGTPRNK